MLLDITTTYNQETIETLVQTWIEIIKSLSIDHDPKKIISFMSKVGIVSINDSKKLIHVGIANEFVLLQVKKFFHKSLQKIIRNMFSSDFAIDYMIYTPFQNKNNPLLVNLSDIFTVSIQKTEKAIYKNNPESLELANDFGIKFNPNNTFENLVVGGHNEFAVSVAKSIVDNPGTQYNPLFIYSPVGLGKTHISHAIGQAIIKKDNSKILYLPATVLIDHILLAIRKNKLNSLIQKISSVDILLIDDVQFLSNKEKTQEVFLNIFNELVMHNKQVIFTSDQAPKNLVNIEARLRSRFAKGITVDIQEPDYETRIAILQSKLKQKGEDIDLELLDIIANNIKNNVRELEGAINIILTKKKLNGHDITEKTIYESLDTLGYSHISDRLATFEDLSMINTKSIISFEKVVEFVASYYQLSPTELKSNSRNKEITQARQMLMSIAKNHFNRTLEKIGSYFGGKNHTTVLYSCKNFSQKIKSDKDLQHDYNILSDKLGL